MPLHPTCPGCGARFSIDDRFAGRSARCKKCGSSIHIPAPGDPAPAPALAVAPAFHRNRSLEPATAAATPLGNRRPDSWIDAVNSHVGLVPITTEHLAPVRPILPSALADEPPSGPYRVTAEPSLPALAADAGRPAGPLTLAYRHQLLNALKVFRWLNQTAYLISVPFIMLFLFGVITRSHGFVALGATAVILLNITRLVSGLANLIVIPFRESPVQGIIFLIPPLTLFYLIKRWSKVKNAVLRVIGPAGTVGIIVLTFVFTPWLRGDDSPASFNQELREGVKAVKETLREELEIAPKHPATPSTKRPERRPPVSATDLLDPG